MTLANTIRHVTWIVRHVTTSWITLAGMLLSRILGISRVTSVVVLTRLTRISFMMSWGRAGSSTARWSVGRVDLARGGVVVVMLSGGRGVNLSGGGVLMRWRRLVVTRLGMTAGGGGRALVRSVQTTGLTGRGGGGGGIPGTRMTLARVVREAEVQRSNLSRLTRPIWPWSWMTSWGDSIQGCKKFFLFIIFDEKMFD